MRHCLILFIAILSFYSSAQKREVDRTNYQLLWEVSRDDMEGKAFLFGTYHSNDNDVFDFPDVLYSALFNSDAVILETDLTEFMLDESTIIPDVGYNKSYLLNWIIPVRSADKVTHTFYGSDEGRPQFIDMYFKQVADNCQKAFHPLETIDDQLRIGLDNTVDPDAPKNIKLISRADLKQKYLEGNASDIHKYTRNSTLEYTDLYKDLIVNRNIKMTDGIDTLIHKYKSSFIAVGASHLLGPKGIVPLLKGKGYTVKLVESQFSEEETEAEIKLKECNQYKYVDQRYGAAVKFGGKPAVMELGNADLLIQYQELGQGNSYSLTLYNYGVEVDLDKYIQDYFYNSALSISSFDSVMVDNQTMAYQGLINLENGEKRWIRVFKKGNVQYTLAANGGYRFMNSNRHLDFFNSFQFLDIDDKTLSEIVTSRSQTMRLKFPKNYYTETKKSDYDDVWDAKWIDPSSGEMLYAYESIVTDNTISYSNKGFGDYILNRYNSDSITIIDERYIPGAYIVKSYITQVNGNKIYGKIKQVGNLIQCVEYIGKNETRKEKFLNSFDTLYSFPTIKDEVKIKNKDFETKATKKGFEMETLDIEDRLYRNTKVYTLADTEKSIYYHVLIKKFEPWAFSQKNTRDLLVDQITWPEEGIVKEIDTTFDLTNKNPSMHFNLYYPESENKFKGIASVVGKNIVIATVTYPQKAEEQYQHLSFLDSLLFLGDDSTPIHEVNIPKLKNEIMINEGVSVDDLVFAGHISDSMMNEMLDWSVHFWNSFDPSGVFQATMLFEMDLNSLEKDFLTYWRERSNSSNKFFTIAVLYAIQKLENPSEYTAIASEIKSNNFNEIDFYKVLEINDPKNNFLIQIWPIFSELLEDSLAWSTSFIIPKLLESEFFQEYFTSDQFVKAITSEKQPPWAAFRYFEIMYEYGVPKQQFLKMLEEWGRSKNDHKTGSISAWKTIVGEKTSVKDKRLIKKDAAVAISYSKVMAVSETPVYSLLTYEQMIGYIAFDHYKDAYFDKRKSLTHIENKTINIEGEELDFGFYKVVENDNVYYMARKLPINRGLPSYGGFGNDTYFVYGSSVYQPERIEVELKTKILEEKQTTL